MTSASFSTTLLKDADTNATGIQVPGDAVVALGAGKKPKVKVTVNGYTYRSTVAVFGGDFFLPMSAEHRTKAGLAAGDSIEVSLELDTEPRLVDVPADLAAALHAAGLMAAFEAASYTNRKEFARQVTEAKSAETRARRIEAILKKLSLPGK